MFYKFLTGIILFLLSQQAFSEAGDLDISSTQPWLTTALEGREALDCRLSDAFYRREIIVHEDWHFVEDISVLSQMVTGRFSGEDATNSFSAYAAYNYNHQHDAIFMFNKRIVEQLKGTIGVEFERDSTTHQEIENEGFFGLRYMLPLMIDALYRVDFTGSHKLELNSGFQLTNKASFMWFWDTDGDYRFTLAYELHKHVYLSVVADSIFHVGGGLRVRF